MGKRALMLLAGFTILLSVPLVLLAYSFKTIDVPGASTPGGGTAAEGINVQGEVVGIYYDSVIHSHGFLLKKGKYTTIDFPGALDSALRDINSRGDITGEYDNDGLVSHGFLLDGGKFTTVDFPGAANTYYLTINDSEEMAGTYDTAGTGGTSHGFVFQRGRFTTIDFPGSVATFVTGINNQGDVVGIRESVFVQQPVLGLNRSLDPVCDKVPSCSPLWGSASLVPVAFLRANSETQ